MFVFMIVLTLFGGKPPLWTVFNFFGLGGSTGKLSLSLFSSSTWSSIGNSLSTVFFFGGNTSAFNLCFGLLCVGLNSSLVVCNCFD